MITKTLSKEALHIIEKYQNLKIDGIIIECPYFINKTQRIRAGLRVNIGKGSIKEIEEEIKILAAKQYLDLTKTNSTELKRFLIENKIGIDCSGFVYYVLDAELKAKGLGGIKKHLKFPLTKNILRKLLAKIRTAENTNVKTLVNDKNSTQVEIKQIKPGDLIYLLGSGKENNFDHILIIYKVDYEEEKPKTIYYSHSLKWQADGKYGGGVRQGKIKIKNFKKNLLEQEWIENNKTGKENETFTRLKEAKEFGIRRLIKN